MGRNNNNNNNNINNNSSNKNHNTINKEFHKTADIGYKNYTLKTLTNFTSPTSTDAYNQQNHKQPNSKACTHNR